MKNNHNDRTKEYKNPLRRVLILAASIITAIAVAVACAICMDVTPAVDVDAVGPGEVSSSATYTNRTGNLTASGAINNGDILDYTFTGGVVNVTIPNGTYKLFVWGAQGASNGSRAGGLGGYATGSFTVTGNSQTLYIAVGGQGNTFNGGGSSTYGGGGATHISKDSGQINSSTARNSMVIAAGGGGGAGVNAGGTGGAGGGGNGVIGANSSWAKGGGPGTTGGAGSGGAPYNSANTPGSAGSAGKGGAGGTSNTRGGGGGGGWYGGGGGGSDIAGNNTSTGGGGGGGGSGYTGGVTGASVSSGSKSGSGQARIQVVNVNQSPKTKSASITLFARGTGSKLINASDIATDPEGTALAFTNGTASNLDAFTTTGNTGLYLNSACSTLATKYFDWTWTSATQAKITNVKMYPRAGVDGSPSNGNIVLYARVRDSYGNSSQRGWSVIPFTVNVPVTSVTERSKATVTDGVSANNEYSYMVGRSETKDVPTASSSNSKIFNPNGTNRYTVMLTNSLRLKSTFTIKASELVGSKYASDQVLIALNSTTAITGSNRKYRIVEYDTANSPHKITAYNTNRVAIANAFDQISIECLAPEPAYQVFAVTLYVVEPTTAYGSSYPRVVPGCSAIPLEIVFKMDNTRPVLKNNVNPVVTLKTLETQSVSLSQFFGDNDTPSGMSAATHQISNVIVATREFIQLDKYGKVVPTTRSDNKSYFNLTPGVSSYTKDDTADSLSTGMFKGDKFSTGFKDWYISSGASNTAFVQYSIDNNKFALNLTGLRATYDMYKSNRAQAATPIVTGGTSTGGVTTDKVGGLNPGHFYILIQISDRNDTSDKGIWLPLGIQVNNAAPTNISKERGGAGWSTMPTANGDPTESFYFTPMGITTSGAVRELKPIGFYDSDGDLTQKDLKPLSADPDNFYTANMLSGFNMDIAGTGNSGVLNELTRIKSSQTLVSDIQNSVANNKNEEYFSVEIIPIYIPKEYFGGRVKKDIGSVDVNRPDYIKIDGLKITLNGWTHNRFMYATVGIVDSAGASVNVDIAINVTNKAPKALDGSGVATVDYIANGKTVKSSYEKAGKDGIPTVTYNIPMHSSVIITPYDLLSDENLTVDYPLIPKSENDPKRAFTLNGLSGAYTKGNGRFAVGGTSGTLISGLANSDNSATNKINVTNKGGADFSSDDYIKELKSTLDGLQKTKTFGKLSTGNLFTSAAEANKTTRVEGLFFERNSDSTMLDGYTFNPYYTDGNGNKPYANNFTNPYIIGDMFVTANFGSVVDFGGGESYNVDYMIVTANTRTQSGAPAEIMINVRDRMGAGATGDANGVTTIRVVVNVINSSPRVQDPDKVYTLSTDPTAADPTAIIINATVSTTDDEVTKDFLIDNEGDAITFHVGEPVAIVDGKGSDADVDGNDYLGKYLQVALSAKTMTITALSSTQNIPALFIEFYVTDGRYTDGALEISKCRIQVEVLNALPTVNRDDADGFADEAFADDETDRLNLWTVDTVDTSDMSKTRYFASSAQAAELVKTKYNASSDQVKRLLNDSDDLQNIILSPVTTSTDGRVYFNADLSKDPVDYKSKVPTFAVDDPNAMPIASNLAAGVIIGLKQPDNGSASITKYFAKNSVESIENVESSIDIIYFVGGNAYSAKGLRKGDYDTTVDWDEFFDDQGRWKVTDWAVSIQPGGNPTVKDEYIQLEIKMRDDAAFGGDSAGIDTAYEKNKKVVVKGYVDVKYQLAINSLGIVPYTYYNQFDGYYTVRDGKVSTTHYVPTYDGNKETLYDNTYPTIYLSGNKIVESTGGDKLKDRTASMPDNTFAGVHSGQVYAAGNSYDFDPVNVVGGGEKVKENAFKYSDTITVANSGYTYLPMSYVALRQGIVNTDAESGTYSFPVDRYVAYNIGSAYNRGGISAIASAISINDGKTEWKGVGGDFPLSSNPYVNITAYDKGANNVQASDIKAFEESKKGPYFNKALSVTTINKDGNSVYKFPAPDGSSNISDNAYAKNLVGNGNVMYLEGQEDNLQENLFGLIFSKKSTRATASSLTITISVAECQRSGDYTQVAAGEGDSNSTAKVTFKLEIANSPIELVQVDPLSGVHYDDNKGYYTTVKTDTGAGAYNIELLRKDVQKAGSADIKATLRYTDNDVVKVDDTIDESKSDKAYFFVDSLYKLNTWVNKDAAPSYYGRVEKYDENNTDLVYTNTSSNDYAQKSVQNYFGLRSGTTADTKIPSSSMANFAATYQPNPGIYGSNINANNQSELDTVAEYREGFSRFFDVTTLENGSILSITPRAKTTLNVNDDIYTSANRAQYYKDRGLVYDTVEKAGYYPLKVLIYDSHGDGFLSASYVAIEIRIYISSAAPDLSSNLEADGDDKSPNKKIDVALPVSSSYMFNVFDVVQSDVLLKKDSGEVYWKSDYTALKESAKTSQNKIDLFKVDTGQYLVSPFGDKNYDWRNTTNADLRSGMAKLYDSNVQKVNQPDVVMFMAHANYNASGVDIGGALSGSSEPKDNAVHITVNRRTTYEAKQYKNFSFKILFTDNDGNKTGTLTINVEVTNQAPTIREAAVENSQNIKMRVGDSFTIVTTPYDKFTGEYIGENGTEEAGNTVSAKASTSYKRVIEQPNLILSRNLLKVQGDSNYQTAVKYEQLTASAVDDDEEFKLRSYDPEIVKAQHLGYLAIADDDTPWSLRITNINYYDISCFNGVTFYDAIPKEGYTSGDYYALDTVIEAKRVCTDMPITITVEDEEGATVTFTLYVTVESSKPAAIETGDKQHDRSEALLPTFDKEDNEQIGVFETYMAANSESTKHQKDVDVVDNILGKTREVANVYGELELRVNNIAYDPDFEDNNKISLYCEGKDYGMFTFNDMPMEYKEDNNLEYFNDFFTISVAEDYQSFKITCLTYNPYSDWDELTFYVRDVGNDTFDNAIPITIRISTLNAALTNDRQSNIDKVTNNIIDKSAVDTVYVKPYDDYIGASADFKALSDEEKKKVLNVSATYQFLNYYNKPESIDQPDVTGWGINDLDVLNSAYNRNYNLRVYALMQTEGDEGRQYRPLTLNAASALFNLDSTQLQNHYWTMKDASAMKPYFVGGVYAGGGAMGGVNTALNMFLEDYFVFDIGDDGVSLSFRPVTANLEFDILFYVEVHKDITGRNITRAGASVDAGTLFKVEVKDSAPIANTDNEKILSFEGKINESHVFTVYDDTNPLDSLFIDSDLADNVSINAFKSAATAQQDYETALAEADCDWKSRDGVPRAIDITVNNEDETVGDLPAHSLKVTIRRRIDVKDDDGNYLSKVKLPIVLTGTDDSNRSVSTHIYVTIVNSDVTFNEVKLANEPRKFNNLGVGYEFNKGENGMYTMDAYLAPDSGALELALAGDNWLKDADYTSNSADTDSYRLAKPGEQESANKYLSNEDMSVYPEDGETAIATIHPVYGNNGAHEDFDHFTGFTITVSSYTRGITGVAYMRILDRSADPLESEGVVIMVRITVLNAAPTVIAGKDKTQYVIIGSDSADSAPVSLDINQFITDLNGDEVRIFGMAPLTATNVHCSNPEDNGGNIVRVDVVGDNDAPTQCTITARKGFYGKQSVLISVADGDLATDLSVRTTTFTVEITVVYDFSQVGDLNAITAWRSLPVKITPEKLFKDVTDTFDADNESRGDMPSTQALASAEGVKTFNPGSDYYITDLTTNVTAVTISLDDDGDYQFVCTREVENIEFNVKFKRKVDKDNPDAPEFNKTFTASIGKNTAPILIEQIRRTNEYTFHTRDGEYGLDTNGNVTLTTAMLFSDPDIANGDRLVFDPNKTYVTSPTLCSVRVSDDGLLLYLTFNMRGETDLTVGIMDRTGETTSCTFRIKNIDRPAPSVMDTVKISYESYPFIWYGAAGGLVLIILLIILIVLLAKRRKRKREELEAILVSEMELEEQMMRLSGGIGSQGYQSFGYLPPTMPVQNDPGMMIGAGGTAPQNDVIGLNPGQEPGTGANGSDNSNAQ